MKRTIILAIAAMAMMGAQAQVVKIIKGEEVIATYPASAFDKVVFEPAQAMTIDGTYDADLTVTLVEMDMGVLVNELTKFTVTSTGQGVISLSMPSCYYPAMDIELPAVTIEDIAVQEADGAITFSQDYSGTIEGQPAGYSGDISGAFYADGTFRVVETMKYGKMPFTLNMVYTSIEAAE